MKSVQNIHWEDWCWSWNSNTLVTWCEELTHLKISWCWEWLKAGGEGDDRGWEGWIASPTWWTQVWWGSGSWWSTGKPGVLKPTGSQRVGHDWATGLNWLRCGVYLASAALFLFGEFSVCFSGHARQPERSLFLDQESHSGPWQWEHQVLPTGPPRNLPVALLW